VSQTSRAASAGPPHEIASRRARPLVSIIIPTYNRRGLIVESVQSVLGQGGAVEIIVVDDGSTDGTVEHLKALRLPARVFQIPHTGVIGKVRNIGIGQARGEMIAFLDSDDIWLPGKIESQLDYLASHPGISVTYTDAYQEESGGILDETRFQQFPPRSRVIYRETILRLCVHTSTVLMRRAVLEKVGLFNEELVLYEDADMWSRVSEEYELGFVAQPLVVVRPDRDPNHLVADRRLLLQEARKYLKLYEERRRGKPRSVEEIRATQKFARALVKLEDELGKTHSGGPPWR